MNKEIREQMETAILESMDRAQGLDGEDRARELKNVAILADKLREDYETEEGFLDKRHKMEFDEEIEKRKIDVEKHKIDSEAKSRRKLNVNTVFGSITTLSTAGLCMWYESRGHIMPKVVTNLTSKLFRQKD